MVNKKDLAKDIAEVLNKHSVENTSNTPDFILAEMLVEHLDVWVKTSRERERWYGHRLEIGGPTKIVEGT
jgi:hypothetical protein